MLTHLQRPLTGRYRAELFDHDLNPARGNALVVVAFLISTILVGIALALRL